MSDNLADVKCYNCHKKGPFKSSCPQKKRNEKGKKSHFKKEFVDVVASNSYESARMLATFVFDTQRSKVMDSRCTYQMCPVKVFFKILELNKGGVVLLGKDKTCKLQGIRSIRLKMFDN